MPSSKTSDVKAISKKASSFLKNRKNANVLLYLLSDADVSALTSFMWAIFDGTIVEAR